MSRLTAPVALLAPVLMLAACTSQPTGPSIAVMPAPNKPFEVFQGDQASCKSYADSQVAGEAQQANNKQVLTGVLGTALGAGLGAAIGGGRGAGIGAGAGALGGTVFGAGSGQRAEYTVQQRYDIAYSQCMYARGNQVPGFQAVNAYPTPPTNYSSSWSGGSYPPSYYPPPGYPPPYAR